jgi:hypothetical protein
MYFTGEVLGTFPILSIFVSFLVALGTEPGALYMLRQTILPLSYISSALFLS